MEDNDIYDYTRMLECVCEYEMSPPVRYLFLDEFQDFSPLQYEIYEQWKADKDIEKIWLAGDDAQAIYRFSGGSPAFMLNTECTKKQTLPVTYRHGEEIFDNSQEYIRRMSVKEPCDVSPSDEQGEVVKCCGTEWLSEIEGRILKMNVSDFDVDVGFEGSSGEGNFGSGWRW
jgi:Superfamily I DNA and RNA helicases